ncbi:PQ loop repeat [Carpediemonas membranifera]|uniref:PQ loop repeat n=1 Tax=Carpediemonas membranifera TaxID=201153 RepID=A0A8J6E124_9EUKA|nr:PQ loop repeat [Carpediemonas membranifera]|eukprot:KAG9390082.1 PQ loop repeat [Carpediemonas membranifera]
MSIGSISGYLTFDFLLKAISFVLGWASFFIWSASFWPQIVKNFYNRSMVGYSLDFGLINLAGFFCYTIYNICLRFVRPVQDVYISLHGDVSSISDIPVHVSDVLFSAHAFMCCGVLMIQYVIFPAGHQRPGWYTAVFLLLSVAIFTVPVALAVFDIISPYYILASLGLIKNAASVIMYLPQLVMNIKRRSTEGWAIMSSILDITASTMYLAQLIVDLSHQHFNILENLPKFLFCISLMFDTTFVFQRFVLYRKNMKRIGMEREHRAALDLEADTTPLVSGMHALDLLPASGSPHVTRGPGFLSDANNVALAYQSDAVDAAAPHETQPGTVTLVRDKLTVRDGASVQALPLTARSFIGDHEALVAHTDDAAWLWVRDQALAASLGLKRLSRVPLDGQVDRIVATPSSIFVRQATRHRWAAIGSNATGALGLGHTRPVTDWTVLPDDGLDIDMIWSDGQSTFARVGPELYAVGASTSGILGIGPVSADILSDDDPVVTEWTRAQLPGSRQIPVAHVACGPSWTLILTGSGDLLWTGRCGEDVFVSPHIVATGYRRVIQSDSAVLLVSAAGDLCFVKPLTSSSADLETGPSEDAVQCIPDTPTRLDTVVLLPTVSLLVESNGIWYGRGANPGGYLGVGSKVAHIADWASVDIPGKVIEVRASMTAVVFVTTDGLFVSGDGHTTPLPVDEMPRDCKHLRMHAV